MTVTWEQARTGKDQHGWKLGGSSAGTVLGLSPFSDRFTLWARLRDGEAEPDERELDEDEISEVQEAGNILEDAILHWYAKRTGRLVIPPAYVAEWMLRPNGKVMSFASEAYEHARELAEMMAMTATVYYGPDDDGRVIFRSITNPFQTGTYDAFVLDKERGYGIIDAKNVKLYKKYSWDNHGVPPYYKAQNHHYLMLAPFKWTGWAVLFGGQHLGIYDMDRDEEFIATIDREERAFVKALDSDEPPPQSVTGSSVDTLKQLFPEVEKGTSIPWKFDEAVYTQDGLPILPDVFDRDWLHVTLTIREYHKRKSHAEATVRYLMKESQELVLPSGVTYERKAYKREGKQYTKIIRHGAPKEDAELATDPHAQEVDAKMKEMEDAVKDLFGE